VPRPSALLYSNWGREIVLNLAMITWQISSRIADASIPHNPVYAGLPRTYLKIAEGSVARGSKESFL
jgi:hypothetical protein